MATESRVWGVGALCRAIADALESRFNPVQVAGELTGVTRAASGHVYFALKDEAGQLRCAMFRRAASLLDFDPQNGAKVVVRGRLGVYEARGELQLIVESMTRAGQGNLFEEFLRLKAKLEAEGLFDPARKRPIPVMPRSIGVVTSLGAAALHDVATALQRRVPNIPVVLSAASVQGSNAPAELAAALRELFAFTDESTDAPVDVVLLVRGGGSIEDLWAFNDELLARTIAQSPVPVISGVGHETDFTIADFVADLRAPTPTAAAELAAVPAADWLQLLGHQAGRFEDAAIRYLDRQAQRLDISASRLGRPSGLATHQRMRLAALEQRLSQSVRETLRGQSLGLDRQQLRLQHGKAHSMQRQQERLRHCQLRLNSVNPAQVLQRGYVMLTDANNRPVQSVGGLQPGDALRATLADGTVDLTVNRPVQN